MTPLIELPATWRADDRVSKPAPPSAHLTARFKVLVALTLNPIRAIGDSWKEAES